MNRRLSELMSPARHLHCLLLLAAAIAGLLVLVPASALAAGPLLSVTQQSYPTVLKPGGTGAYAITVENRGDQDTSGQITVTDTLPPGVTAVRAGTYLSASDTVNPGFQWNCPNVAGSSVVTCTSADASLPTIFGHSQPPAPLRVDVQIDPAVDGTGINTVAVSGGMSVRDALSVAETRFSATPLGFGIAEFSGTSLDRAGERATQAGAHPDVSTTIAFNTAVTDSNGSGPATGGVGAKDNVKDISVDLPAGLVSNPRVAVQCASLQLLGNGAYGAQRCPSESQVGTVDFNFGSSYGAPREANDVGLYAMVPPRGVPARLAANFGGVLALLDARVRPDGNYALSADVSNISQSLPLISSRVTLWGVPADPIHDVSRTMPGSNQGDTRSPVASAAVRRPFVTAPTSCSGVALVTRVSVASWPNPTDVHRASFDHDIDGDPLMSEGCDKLDFKPAVTVAPSSSRPRRADRSGRRHLARRRTSRTPTGSQAQLRDVKVTLPEGMTINPARPTASRPAATHSSARQRRSRSVPGRREDRHRHGDDAAAGGGAGRRVYVRSQASEDPESGDMFRMALVLENKERGLLVKLPGRIRVNHDTGRIVTEFDDNPQLPVEQHLAQLKSGPRAPLATPATCGTSPIDTQLTSWAGHDVEHQRTFTVACTAGLGGFAPTLLGRDGQPGRRAFSPFALSITKPDGNAPIDGLSMSCPTGLLAKLKGNLGTQVGTVTAFAGPGSNPLRAARAGVPGGRLRRRAVLACASSSGQGRPFDLGTVGSARSSTSIPTTRT